MIYVSALRRSTNPKFYLPPSIRDLNNRALELRHSHRPADSSFLSLLFQILPHPWELGVHGSSNRKEELTREKVCLRVLVVMLFWGSQEIERRHLYISQNSATPKFVFRQ